MKCPNDDSELYKLDAVMQCPTCPFNFAPNTKVLETMHAWVSVDSDGHEGFIAADVGQGVPMVLVHSELRMVERLRGTAIKACASIPGYHARLIKFSRREILEDVADDPRSNEHLL